MKRRAPKIKAFVEECLASGITSPSSMRDAYQTYYNKKMSADAFEKALKRLGITKEKRNELTVEAVKEKEGKDILDYEQVKAYIAEAESKSVLKYQIEYQLKNIRRVWEMMGRTNPSEWTRNQLYEAIKKDTPMIEDNRGRTVYTHPAKVRHLLTSVSTMFPGILVRCWSAGLTRDGELKDYLTFEEFDMFIANLDGLMWEALFKAQINLGCREGTLLRTGILSLMWEDIDFKTKRCSLHEKGSKGDAARLWKNLPLDLFPWLHGWDTLMRWHEECGKPTSGRVFPISYSLYSDTFHATRKRCEGRISGDKDTLIPHIFRKTHAQWLVKMWIPLELICGQFPNGYFGVGWDNPAILLKFYITLEGEQYEKAEATMQQRIEKLGLVSPLPLSAPTVTESIQV